MTGTKLMRDDKACTGMWRSREEEAGFCIYNEGDLISSGGRAKNPRWIPDQITKRIEVSNAFYSIVHETGLYPLKKIPI